MLNEVEASIRNSPLPRSPCDVLFLKRRTNPFLGPDISCRRRGLTLSSVVWFLTESGQVELLIYSNNPECMSHEDPPPFCRGLWVGGGQTFDDNSMDKTEKWITYVTLKENHIRVYTTPYKPNSPCGRATDPRYWNRVTGRKSQGGRLCVAIH